MNMVNEIGRWYGFPPSRSLFIRPEFGGGNTGAGVALDVQSWENGISTLRNREVFIL